MGAINTSRSNIKSTARTTSGRQVGAELGLEVTESDTGIAVKALLTVTIDGKIETHEIEIRTEGVPRR